MATDTYVLTHKGRARAVLTRLEQRWDTLTIGQKAQAIVLVERLAEAIRRERPADPRPAA